MRTDTPGRTVEELRGQITPAFAARAVRPAGPAQAQQAWELLIAGYLYLGGLGAGAFIAVTVAAWAGFELGPSLVTVAGWTLDWSTLFVLWGPFATALGASLLVFHLGRNWWRFWSASFNPRTSWMARGFSILLAFIALGALTAVVAVLLPSWQSPPSLWVALQVAALAAAVGTALYTGVLLRSMRFIPAWKSSILPWLFLASALSTGAMGVALGAVVYGWVAAGGAGAGELVNALERAEPFILAVEGVLLATYVRHLLHRGTTGAASARLWLRGRWGAGFWAGIVGLALTLPFVLAVVNVAVRAEALSVVAALCVLTGGFLLRCGVLAIGVPEAPPLQRLTSVRSRGPVAAPARHAPREAGA